MPAANAKGANKIVPMERRRFEDEVLRSVGECVYSWDIASDALEWNDGAAGLLNVPAPHAFATGRAFNSLLKPNTHATRDDAFDSKSKARQG